MANHPPWFPPGASISPGRIPLPRPPPPAPAHGHPQSEEEDIVDFSMQRFHSTSQPSSSDDPITVGDSGNLPCRPRFKSLNHKKHEEVCRTGRRHWYGIAAGWYSGTVGVYSGIHQRASTDRRTRAEPADQIDGK